jgi:glycosyltransferase involved in cell wall biosynthesis
MSARALPDSGTEAGAGERPLSILHVTASLGLGGAETMLYRLVCHMPHIRHRVICLGAPDWYSERLAEKGVGVEHLGMTSAAAGLRGLTRLHRLIRRSEADVLQGWMYRANLVGGLAARLARIPAVWSIHCASLEPLRPAARAFAYASGAVAGWVPRYVINCSSRAVALHDQLGFDRAPGGVVHNGYDAEAFRPDEAQRARLRQALGMPADRFLLGSVSRWHPEKDIPNLLAALQILRDRPIGDVRCVLIGNGLAPDSQPLAREIEARGLSLLVVPLGRRSDIAELMRALDVHVLPSRSEAFPNTIAEAMLSGTPCIVTDAGDGPLMVGDTGWVAPPASPEALAGRIEEALREWREAPDAWQRRRAAARSRIAENYSLERMARGYETVWREVAASRRGRS